MSTNLESRVAKLEEDVATARKWLWVIGIVAGIFGVGAAELWKTLSAATVKAATAKQDSAAAATSAADAASKASAALAEARDASARLQRDGARLLDDLRPKFESWIANSRQHLGITNMYSLWVTKATGEVSVNKWNAVMDWNPPEQEYPATGAFDRKHGVWTCPKAATYLIVFRLAVAPVSGVYVGSGIAINDQRVSNAWSASDSTRGAISLFARRLNRGDRVSLWGETENSADKVASDQPISSLTIVQVSPE